MRELSLNFYIFTFRRASDLEHPDVKNDKTSREFAILHTNATSACGRDKTARRKITMIRDRSRRKRGKSPCAGGCCVF